MDWRAGEMRPGNSQPSISSALASLLSLIGGIAVVVWTTDSEFRFVSVAGTSVGAGPGQRPPESQELVGETVETLFSRSPHHRGALDAHRKALRGEHAFFTSDLNGLLLDGHVEPLRGPGNAITGTIGVALDRTEKLVADQALRLSEQSYRSLVDEAPYGICRVTRSGQLLQVNPAMLEMLGYNSGEELLARDLPPIFAVPAQFDEFRKSLLDANGKALHGFESVWLRSDDREIQVSIGGRVVGDAAGDLLYLDVVAENVTERKQLEAQLRQAQKMQAIGQLAGGVAHDFNNLLTIIAGQVEVVLDRELDEDVQFRLEEVKRAAERAAVLTRQLLAFSRRQVLQTKVLDPNRVISHMTQMLTRLIGENIKLSFLPGEDVGHIKADPNQIEQVLMNLAVNARDAMPAGGRLTIRTSDARLQAGSSRAAEGILPGRYVLLSVKDTGHGMDRQTQARIFEPFFTTKKTGEGTGLGLSTVYGVVKQSGGHIRVESEPGHGSTFKIYLPYVEEPELSPGPPSPAVSPRGSESILLVEDEDGVRELMAEHLKNLGYHVLTAHDGAAALDAMESHSGRIDLLLSDVVMPKVGGRELARELRKARSGLKVVFVSGHVGHDVAEKDLALPDAAFLAKPFSMQVLSRTIREVLDGSSQ